MKRNNVTPDYAKDIWRSLEKDIFPTIGEIPVQEIKARTLVEALEPIKARGALETVRRLVQRINEIMIYAVNTGLIEWQLLTLVLPSEASSARWSEIEFEAKLWTIPAERMKAKREHIVPLSSQAIDILYIMKPISAHREFIFPSRNNPKHPMNSQTANAALKRIGYGSKLVAHGLRSIASTAMNEAGHNADVIEAALAHADKNEVRRAYNRSLYLEQREKLMQWWGNFIYLS